MKKLFIFIMLAFPCMLFGQSIVGNTYSGDDHIVITDKKICRSMTDRMVLSVGLSAIRTNPEKKDHYFLDFKITSAGKITMAAGGNLIITLCNGNEIKLSAADDTTQGLVRDIHSVNGLVTHDFSTYPSFAITQEQVEAIISTGVKKIQCNTSPNAYSKEFKKDQVGKALSERWELLKSKL